MPWHGLRTWLERNHKEVPPGTPLFLSDRKKRVSYNTVCYQWIQLCTWLGLLDTDALPLYTLHQLRYTRINEWIARFGKVTTQGLIGQFDSNTLDSYAEVEVGQDALRDAMRH